MLRICNHSKIWIKNGIFNNTLIYLRILSEQRSPDDCLINFICPAYNNLLF